MKNLVPIGRFSRVCQLTIPALRLYDELGLLRPAAVDPDTSYRYYSLAQARDAERIRLLRAVDMPLEGIRAVLSARDGPAVRDLLERHRAVLIARAEAYRAALASLDRLIEREERPMQYEIGTRETVAQPVASVRGHTPVDAMPEFFRRAYADVFGVLGRAGVRPAGMPVSIYHDPEFRADDVDVEVAVPIAEPVPSEGRVKGGQLPGGTVAWTLHIGPYDDIGGAYRALAEWAQSNGRELAGPPRECYLTDPHATPNPADYRTEVIWPLK